MSLHVVLNLLPLIWMYFFPTVHFLLIKCLLYPLDLQIIILLWVLTSLEGHISRAPIGLFMLEVTGNLTLLCYLGDHLVQA